MAIPLGFGIGDCIAVSKLIYQVSHELRSNGYASPDYQETIVTLQFLDAALHKLFELLPDANGKAKLDFVRAIAISCRRLLQEFLEKITCFEPSLGSKPTSSPQKIFYRRMQWNMKYCKDVTTLRSKLSTHLDTINLSLSMQTVESVQSINQLQIKQTTSLMHSLGTLENLVRQVETTQFHAEAKLRIQAHAVDFIKDSSQSQAVKIDAVLHDTDSVLSNQETILSKIDNATHILSNATSNLADIQVRTQDLDSKAGVTLSFLVSIVMHLIQGAVQIRDITTKLSELYSFMVDFSGKMLEAIGKILEAFDQVRRLLTRLEHCLPMQIYLPIVKFRDPFGYEMALPYELSRRWQTFKGMLAVAFMDKQGAWRVERGLYGISHKRLGIALNPNYWENAIRENDELMMSIIIPEQSAEISSCPWKSCNANLMTAKQFTDGMNCPQCHKWIAKPMAQDINLKARSQITQQMPAFTGAVISAASDDVQQIVSLNGQEQCLKSSPLKDDKADPPSENIDLYRSIQVSVDGIDACGLLRAGARFHGTQRSGQRKIYNITIAIIGVIIPYGYISGFMTSSAPDDSYPPMTTFFEGEIIDGKNHKFKTPEKYAWSGTTRTDLAQWSRLPPFKPLIDKFRRDSNFPKRSDFLQKTCSEHVFMRWKEQRLSDSRAREVQGASFDGFYYVCCEQKQGKIHGIYYHAKRKRHHTLELTAENHLGSP